MLRSGSREIAPSLPEGREHRSRFTTARELIHPAIETLKRTLDRGKRHRRFGLRRLPAARAQRAGRDHHAAGRRAHRLSCACTLLGLSSNIMSLGGIAIAIGAMVDAAIVMIENAHKHLERAPPDKPRLEVLIEAATEVGPALFFSLLIITVSFLPIFTLEAQEGRLFRPLAFTKTFAMAAAALLSVTLVPALMVLFVRGKIVPEDKNPVNRGADLDLPAGDPRWCCAHKVPTIASGARRCSPAAVCPASPARLRIHAGAQRRHAALYADDPPRPVGHQGGGTAADAGQDHQDLPRSHVRLRQGRARLDRDRPRADRNVRDRDQPEAGGANGGPA